MRTSVGPGPGGLFDHILNGGAVDHGQEAFGHDPGRGSHAGPSSGGRNHSNFNSHEITFCSARRNIRDMFPR